MKESYIKLPNITVSKLQDVVDYLDENNIEYIEDYKEEVELNKYKEVLDKIRNKCNRMLNIFEKMPDEQKQEQLDKYIIYDKILQIVEETDENNRFIK